MLQYVSGKLAIKMEDSVVVDINGLGYKIYVPGNSSIYLKSEGEQVLVYTYMAVKEDDIRLFGFESMEALEVYKKLITVNGVGAKAGLAIFSALNVNEIKKAIVYEDVAMICRANGVGKKIAQRIIIDLKDKMDVLEVEDNSTKEANNIQNKSASVVDAINALIELGYTRSEATSLVNSVKQEGLSTEDYIKLALKSI